MASDSLNQVGKYIKGANRKADYAIKRVAKKMPMKERARDTVSAVSPFRMQLMSDGNQETVISINFNKPPPLDCDSNCIATACEDYQVAGGGHLITVNNPFEPETVRAYKNGAPLETVQWFEENPGAGQVYVQVGDSTATVVICYSYVVC